jgi:hypothetical protein
MGADRLKAEPPNLRTAALPDNIAFLIQKV